MAEGLKMKCQICESLDMQIVREMYVPKRKKVGIDRVRTWKCQKCKTYRRERL